MGKTDSLKEQDIYDASSIHVLEGLEAVRVRPGMYIGSVSTKGLNHLIYEIVDNSVDEHLAGHCDKIWVTLEADGSATIEDNGRGVSAKDLPRIFERFYRTDASRNSGKGGSGVGLSIVKKIVEDHGGYIWATGKEGEGTCIHFVLRKYVEKEGAYEQDTDYRR